MLIAFPSVCQRWYAIRDFRLGIPPLLGGGVTGSLASPKGRGNNTVNEDVQELPVHGSDLSFGSSLDLLALWQQAYVVPELVTMHFCTPQGRTRPVQRFHFACARSGHDTRLQSQASSERKQDERKHFAGVRKGLDSLPLQEED